MKSFNILSIVEIILSCIVVSHAKLTMVIRHGEKLSDSNPYLSPRGQSRAYCLVNVFGNNGTYATPQKIYAQSPTEKKQSTRPKDTVIPFAKIIGLDVDISYTSGQIKKLVKNIMNTSEEIVLVSWSSDNIPEIAEKFGINNPPKWDSNTFDEIWMIYDQNTPSYYNANSNNNSLSKRETYDGSEGFTLEIVKQDIEDCINENVSKFVNSINNNNDNTSSNTPKLSLKFFMKIMIVLMSLYFTLF